MISGTDPQILVIDDEELIREVTAIMIGDNGGTAISAADGVEGIEIFKKDPQRFHCAVIDFSMPKLNGYEVITELRKIRAGFSVVLITGLAVSPHIDELRKSGKVEFLRKPFHEAELIQAINRAVT